VSKYTVLSPAFSAQNSELSFAYILLYVSIAAVTFCELPVGVHKGTYSITHELRFVPECASTHFLMLDFILLQRTSKNFRWTNFISNR
jgi:hypothetical protein